MHYNFGALIFWNNVRKLKLKMAVAEGIDVPVGPLTIVSFSSAVPEVVICRILGTSAQNTLQGWFIDLGTGVPSQEYVVKKTEEVH